MKKITLVLVVLLLAAPASAEVLIKAVQTAADCNGDLGYHEVTVLYDATSEPNYVRAFALDISLGVLYLDNDANIIDVSGYFRGECTSDSNGYGIFPASFNREIDADDPCWADVNYTPVAELSDLPSDTLGGIDTNGITIEMGSLYEIGIDPPPAKKGVLFTFKVNKSCTVTIAENVTRGGVVMENPDEVVDVNIPEASPANLLVSCRGDVNRDGKVKKNDRAAVGEYLERLATKPAWTVKKWLALNVLNPNWDACGDAYLPLDEKVKKNDRAGVGQILETLASKPAWTYVCP